MLRPVGVVEPKAKRVAALTGSPARSPRSARSTATAKIVRSAVGSTSNDSIPGSPPMLDEIVRRALIAWLTKKAATGRDVVLSAKAAQLIALLLDV